ncbi:hypothetical protein BT93_L2451 [Corymbia citriodora subsp. variegata]|uniref:Uncharacterized protein n=1 Tax=Corymbia citriodora subsp. variegata TaxID=360336 RepID=A0A8T0CP01_CORYI|nr:hypothetical protein BT93_L2451 [Corymbia citriodora subsp. variegata]
MPMEEHAAQSFIFENEKFYYMTKICSVGAVYGYCGFNPLATTTGSGKRSYTYRYDPEYLENNVNFL